MPSWIQLLPGIDLKGEVISAVLIAFNSMLAAAGGIGGGPVYTSILLAFGADVHSAIPIPQAIIFAGSVGLFVINAQQRSAADKSKPGIQWDLVFFLENSVVVGTIVGALLNQVLPGWFLLLSEIVFFTYEGVNSMKKGIQGIKKDKQKFAGRKDVSMDQIMRAELEDTPQVAQVDSVEARSGQAQAQNADLLTGDVPGAGAEARPSPVVVRKRDTRCSHWSYVNVARMVCFCVCFAVQATLQVLRKFQRNCSAGYWLLLAANFVVGVLAIALNDIFLNKSIQRHDPSVMLGVSIERFNTKKARFRLVSMGFVAGIMAAALGLGGGLIKQPLMISIGVPPYVARLASQTMILFTSLTATIGFIAQGQVNVAQVWIFMIISALMFPVGFFASDAVIKCIKSTHVITITVALCLLIGDCFVVVQFILEVVRISKAGFLPGFVNICGQ